MESGNRLRHITMQLRSTSVLILLVVLGIASPAFADSGPNGNQAILLASSIDSDWPEDTSTPRVPRESKPERDPGSNSEDRADRETEKNKKSSIDSDFPKPSDVQEESSTDTTDSESSNQDASSVDPDWPEQ